MTTRNGESHERIHPKTDYYYPEHAHESQVSDSDYLKEITEAQEKVLSKLYYEDGYYFGRDRLYKYLQSHFADMGISRRMVMAWLRVQEVAQLNMPVRTTTEIQRTITKAPLNQVGIDLMDMSAVQSNGKKWIISAIDLFSKYGWALAIPDKEEKTVLNAFKKIIEDMPKKPGVIRSDNGSEFISAIFKNYLKDNGIKQVLGSPSLPQSNGQVERFNGVIKRGLQMQRTQTGSRDWVAFLPIFISNYNDTWQRTIDKTPKDALNEDEAGQEQTHENIKKEVSSKNQIVEVKPKFNVGETVRLRLLKQGSLIKKGITAYNWSLETYRIGKVHPSRGVRKTSYQIENDDGAFSELYYENDLMLAPAVDKSINSQEIFEVSRIIKPLTKKVNGKWEKYFLVAWKNYRKQSDRTDEPRVTLFEDVPEMVLKFEKDAKVAWNMTTGKVTFAEPPKK